MNARIRKPGGKPANLLTMTVASPTVSTAGTVTLGAALWPAAVAAGPAAPASPATAGPAGNAAGEFFPCSSPAGARPRRARGQAGARSTRGLTDVQAPYGSPCAAQAYEADGWY
jgi:hypothetical protein